MAKKKKGKAVTVRKVYVKAKEKARKVRRYAGQSVTKKDIILGVGGAALGGVGGALVLQKMPEVIPPMLQNAITALGGGYLAYKGIKSRNKLIMGLGLGLGAVGARGLIGSVVPSLAGDDVSELWPGYEYNPELSAPFAAPFAGPVDSFAAPLDGVETNI